MTNAEARLNKSLRPRKPEGSLGRTAQDVHLDSHTAPELCAAAWNDVDPIIVSYVVTGGVGCDVARLLSGSNESTGFFAESEICLEGMPIPRQ